MEKEQIKIRLAAYLEAHLVGPKKNIVDRLSDFFVGRAMKQESVVAMSIDEVEEEEEEQCEEASPCLPPDLGMAPQMAMPSMAEPRATYKGKAAASISDYLKDSLDPDAVAKQLNRYMFERDITTAMIYERCYIDRKLISKITSGKKYHPSKNTMLALCIGLRLNLPEAEEFLLLAGYGFSSSSRYELILKFMLENEIYDLDTINEMLYQYNEPCLGA